MKNTKLKRALALVFAMALVLALCAGCGSSSSSSTGTDSSSGSASTSDTGSADSGEVADLGDYEFTLSMHDAETTANAIYLQEWADAINEATDGHVTITLYCSATLSAATDIGDNVLAGAVDIGWLYTSYYAGQFPLSDVINLPMQGFGDPVVSTEVLWELYNTYDDLQEEWSQFKLLMFYGNPGMILASSDTPITSMSDLAGRTIRCPSGPITDVLTSWGGSPITMSPPDIYEALEKNNISAYIFEPAGICNFSLQDVTAYYTDYPLYDGPFGLIMNWDQWNSLPAEYQEIIEGLSGYDASIGAAQCFADDVEVARETITAAGGEFVELSDDAIAEMQVVADEYAETWAAGITSDTLDGAEYLATAKALAEQYAG